MPIEFKRGGRNVSSKAFIDGIMKDAVEAALNAKQEEIHNIASSIIDPETGKRGEVIVRRAGHSLLLRTNGSSKYARELERRLGLNDGEVQDDGEVQAMNQAGPRVYLAHASEDKAGLAQPLAEKLMSNGIDVWLDKWEIRTGQSLRQKMDEGLEDCTHFLVLLTPTSIQKPWVNAEIDAGFMKGLEGRARFMGVRCNVAISDLSPLLQTRLLPELDFSTPGSVDALIADIFDASVKPALGDAPRYIQQVPAGLESWSKAAIAIARHLVEKSEKGCKFDPRTSISEVADALALSEEDVQYGVQDLEDAGLIDRSKTIGSDRFWPNIGLFVEFDPYFLDFDPKDDAVRLATELVNMGNQQASANELKDRFPDWTIRRFNSALNRLEEMRVVSPFRAIGSSPYTYIQIGITDKTRRFVREQNR